MHLRVLFILNNVYVIAGMAHLCAKRLIHGSQREVYKVNGKVCLVRFETSSSTEPNSIESRDDAFIEEYEAENFCRCKLNEEISSITEIPRERVAPTDCFPCW